jgi:hypothetical protein
MIEIFEPTSDDDAVHPGSGFCEICCRQVTSSRYLILERAKEYMRLTIEVLRTVANVLGVALFSLLTMILFFIRERYRTPEQQRYEEQRRRERLRADQEQKEWQREDEWQKMHDLAKRDDELNWSEFRDKREKIIALGGARLIDHDDALEDHQRGGKLDGLVDSSQKGFTDPSEVVKEAEDLLKERLDNEKKDKKKRVLFERYNDKLFESKLRADEAYTHKKYHEDDKAEEKQREADDLHYQAQRIYKQFVLI